MFNESLTIWGVMTACPVTGLKHDQVIEIRDGMIHRIYQALPNLKENLVESDYIVQIKNATVIPGLFDTHCHFVSTGLLAVACDLNQCLSIDQVIGQLEEYRQVAPLGTWIYGVRFDDFKLKEKRAPTMVELDRAFPDIPVFLEHRGYHFGVVNSATLRRVAQTSGLRGLESSSSILPNGVVEKQAIGRIRTLIRMSAMGEVDNGILKAAAREALQSGITFIHTVEGGELFGDEDISIIHDMLDDLPIRVNLIWATTNLDLVHQMGLRGIGGDILVDGTIGSHTAAISHPYQDRPGTCGTLYLSEEEVTRFYTKAVEAGLQASVHAIGDRAIGLALRAIARAQRSLNRKDGLFRIDHFGLPSLDQIQRAADLGVSIATQPPFTYLRGQPGGVYDARLGRERLINAYPLRDIVNAGILMAGGSDSPVVPISGILGLHSCINNPFPKQRLTPLEALTIYTLNGAKLTGKEEVLGSIEVGKIADLVVLDGNPLDSPSQKINDLHVLLTIVGGEIVYQSPDLPKRVLLSKRRKDEQTRIQFNTSLV